MGRLVPACVLALVAIVALLWRGLLALVGVALSIGLVALFLIPAILDGSSALLVGLVTSLAVTFITTVLTNGLGAQTFAAVLGVTVTLLLTCLLAWMAVRLGSLDGRSDETAAQLGDAAQRISLEGIVIASMLIGALGVLAYVGAALPLLLSLRAVSLPFVDGLNSQSVAQPVLAAIVGCLALIVAVPVTTGLASLLVAGIPVAAVPSGHGHAHQGADRARSAPPTLRY